MRIDVELPESSQTILVPDSEQRRLSEILRSNNLPLNTRCGERDMCAGCVVELVSGSLASYSVAGAFLLPGSEMRGCQVRPAGDITIRVPQRSQLTYAPQVLDSYRVNVSYARDPLVTTGLGVAIDIGTTTVAIELRDLQTGEIVGKASGFNKQMHYGDDVLTRINLCSTDASMVGLLQDAIVIETIQPLLAEALNGKPEDEITCFVIAGNATMLHLFVGENPATMGFAPFTPAFLEERSILAGEVGLRPAGAEVVVLPSIAAYVGADLTAGLFASGLMYDEGPSLLVDVGTNGEILLRHEGRSYGCATAAGPAFEGCGLTCGIRAGDGAISHLRIGETIDYEKIGGMKPTGLCGSAFVDFLAEGRRSGLLTAAGRFKPAGALCEIMADTDRGRAVRIAYGQGKRPILVTEGDVAKLLQAKAAIAAGILTLLRRAGVAASEIRTLYLAGGFGMHLDLDSAICCGLLPDFRREQIELVGNTSLGGAVVALLDRNTLAELDRARQGVQIVELNLEPEFADTYLDQLLLP